MTGILNHSTSLKHLVFKTLFLLFSLIGFSFSAFGQLTATFTNTKDACDGLNNGSVDVTVTNSSGTITVNFFGPPNFIFNPADGVPQTIGGLQPLIYLVIVQDDDETVGYTVTINNVTPDLSASVNTTTNNTDCTTPNGAISLNFGGGTGSYTFSWTGPAGPYPNAASLINLPGGSYNVEVFDDGSNCSRVLGPIVLTDPAVAVQTITTPSLLELCPGDDAIVSLGASEVNKTYEILINGVASGFSSPGDAGGGPINITLPSGNFADGNILTVEGYEGVCPRFTMTGSVTVAIFTESVAPTSAAADNPNYCDDALPANITLSYAGGTLGTGATAEWYDDAAFTSSVGSGNNLLIPAPVISTIYYVRFEGSCNITGGQNVSITVDNASVAPTAANIDIANYCDNAAPANITLSYSGGSLGTGATAQWYDDAGFTSSVGSGNNLVLPAPLTSTTYFVRFEGVCGNTAGQTVAVTVDLASTAPTGASVDNPNYCDDAAPANITLSYAGGTLGTGATAQWYDDAGFTSSVGSGNNLSLPAPAVTTTYYVRFEGICNTTLDQNVTVTVDNASTPPTAASVDIPTFCNDAPPANITLSYSGGSLGTGATAEWYDDAGFTSPVGSGNNLSLAAPLVSTTYFVRFEGTCGNTTGQNVVVTVDLASTAPTGASVDNPNYCDDALPANITLTYAGGSLGTGATAQWYDDAGFTSSVGSGNNLTISAPVVTTTYYIRFEGSCNNTLEQNVTVTINSASLAPASASVDSPAYCDDAAPANITLSYAGGSLGTGATAEWYDDAGFTSSVGSGNNLMIAAPIVSTTYFIRFEGICGNTSSQSVNVTVSSASTDPTSASVDSPNYCDDAAPANITLSYAGGILGTGATAQWYDDAGFTSTVGSGNNLTIPTPATTTTYYIRFEGACNLTAAQNVTVNVNLASQAPTAANVDVPAYCDDAIPVNITLSYTGGSLGTGAIAEWYDDAGFTSSVGSGNNLSIAAPLVSTSYFVRFEGTCGNTTDQSVNVTVSSASTDPTAASVDAPTYCDDVAPANITLSYAGGNLGTGATAQWYDDAGFTSPVGTGNNLVIPAPATTTTYYIRFEGACNITLDQNVTVTVDIASVAPTAANVDAPFYCSDAAPTNITLSYTGGSLGTGATAEWYDDAGFTSSIGSGNNVTLGSPAISTTYFVRFEGNCGNTVEQSVLVDVVTPPDAAIAGTSSACANTTETYSVPTGATTYLWTLSGGDGTISSGQGTASITVDWGVTGGNLDVLVTGPAPSSCTATEAVTVFVYSAIADLAPQAVPVCQNAAQPVLVATPEPGATVNWYNGPSATGTLLHTGDSFTPSAAQLDMTTPGTTIFTYTQTIACLTSNDAEVTVNVLTLPNAGSDGSTNACLVDAPLDLFTYLTGSPEAGGTWNDDDGSGALSGSSFDPAVAGLGVYNFTYQVDGTGPCTGETTTAIVTVSVISTSTTPVPEQASYSGCTYATAPTMTTPGTMIRWYADAGLTTQVGAGNSFTPPGNATYFDSTLVGTTTFYVTQDDGCGESSPAMVDIVLDGGSADVNPDELENTYPEQDVGAFEVFNIQSAFPPYDIRLEDNNGNLIYDWVEVTEDRLGNYTYLFTLLPQGNYIAWVRDQSGCMFPIEQSIGLEQDIFIPNVFTPNGDSYNDVFKVLNVSGPIQIHISNRWGVKVFESDDYQNDWDASNLPEGVYFYNIKMAGVVYRGNVEVWRNDGPSGN